MADASKDGNDESVLLLTMRGHDPRTAESFSMMIADL